MRHLLAISGFRLQGILFVSLRLGRSHGALSGLSALGLASFGRFRRFRRLRSRKAWISFFEDLEPHDPLRSAQLREAVPMQHRAACAFGSLSLWQAGGEAALQRAFEDARRKQAAFLNSGMPPPLYTRRYLSDFPDTKLPVS